MKHRTKQLQDMKMPAILGCAGLLALIIFFFVFNSGKNEEEVAKEDKVATLEKKVTYLEDRLYKIEQDLGAARNKIAELDMTLPSITENIEKQLDEFQQEISGTKPKSASASAKPVAAVSEKEPAKPQPAKVAETKKPAVRKTVSKPDRPKAQYHIVKDNETVFGIAQQYGLTVEKLKKMNNLPSDSIFPNQKLRVK